jgi:hypothetical protein
MPLPGTILATRPRLELHPRSFFYTAPTTPVPTYWMDDAFDSRLIVDMTNNHTSALHDHMTQVTALGSYGIDAPSVRVVEITAINTIDKAYDWRYGPVVSPPSNNFWYLPAKFTSPVLYFKALGRWEPGELRRFAIYWDSTATVGAMDYHHLGGISQGWTVALTAGTAGDHYIVVAAGRHTTTR